MPGEPGRLRPEVAVIYCDQAVLLRYGFWEVALPGEWVRATPGVAAFLDRQVGIHEIAAAPGVSGVSQLLAAQGCLTRGQPPGRITLRELRDAFIVRSSAVYGRYYGHAVWAHIRAGDRAALVAWLAHNLQLSRSVGQTAARAAVGSSDGEARATFQRNCIEEYDHFERYFKVDDPALGISSDDFTRAVPSPATLSFTTHMLWMGERDWVAHALVALFQERTEHFAADAAQFYKAVERSTRLRGFFRDWLVHARYDSRMQHADAFGALLDRDTPITRESLDCSLRNASFAVHHLLRALDEIALRLGESEGQKRPPLLRLPPEGGRIDPDKTCLLESWPAIDRPIDIVSADLAELAGLFERAGLLRSRIEHVLGDDLAWFVSSVAASTLRALGNAECDEELLLFGTFVDRFAPSSSTSDSMPRSPACHALAAFLDESARIPWRLALMLRLLVLVVPSEDLQCRSAGLDRYLQGIRVTDLDRTLVLMIQLAELVLAWQHEDTAAAEELFSW